MASKERRFLAGFSCAVSEIRDKGYCCKERTKILGPDWKNVHPDRWFVFGYDWGEVFYRLFWSKEGHNDLYLPDIAWKCYQLMQDRDDLEESHTLLSSGRIYSWLDGKEKITSILKSSDLETGVVVVVVIGENTATVQHEKGLATKDDLTYEGLIPLSPVPARTGIE